MSKEIKTALTPNSSYLAYLGMKGTKVNIQSTDVEGLDELIKPVRVNSSGVELYNTDALAKALTIGGHLEAIIGAKNLDMVVKFAGEYPESIAASYLNYIMKSINPMQVNEVHILSQLHEMNVVAASEMFGFSLEADKEDILTQLMGKYYTHLSDEFSVNRLYLLHEMISAIAGKSVAGRIPSPARLVKELEAVASDISPSVYSSGGLKEDENFVEVMASLLPYVHDTLDDEDFEYHVKVALHNGYLGFLSKEVLYRFNKLLLVK